MSWDDIYEWVLRFNEFLFFLILFYWSSSTDEILGYFIPIGNKKKILSHSRLHIIIISSICRRAKKVIHSSACIAIIVFIHLSLCGSIQAILWWSIQDSKSAAFRTELHTTLFSLIVYVLFNAAHDNFLYNILFRNMHIPTYSTRKTLTSTTDHLNSWTIVLIRTQFDIIY